MQIQIKILPFNNDGFVQQGKTQQFFTKPEKAFNLKSWRQM